MISFLIHFVYPNLSDYYESVPGDTKEYFSADTAEEQSDSEHQYPMEFLNSLIIGGLPPHKLSLKIGSPIILLHNIHPSDGLCNETRFLFESIL